MVDVKVKIDEYAAFPTMIYKFEANLGTDNDRNMATYIRTKNEMQTEDDLMRISFFRPLAETVQHTMVDILKKLEFEYEKIEITGMWGNRLKEGMTHPPHTHSNNIFSGVYYLEGGSQIQFFDPRPQASVLHPNTTEDNFNNTSMLAFSSEKGVGLIFPSWLQHWVVRTDKTRISISWNVILRGDYGKPNTLQNSHI